MNEKCLKILNLIQTLPDDLLVEALTDYHSSDIADTFNYLDRKEFDRLLYLLPKDLLADIFVYLDNPNKFILQIDNQLLVKIIAEMDADDAVDFFERLEPETRKNVEKSMSEYALSDIKLINSYDKGDVGSLMTTNYVYIYENYTVKEAMRSVIHQASNNDNIDIIYVINHESEEYEGIIFLQDLLCARSGDSLASITKNSYPVLYDSQQIDTVIESIKEYDIQSVAVLSHDNRLLGTITSDDIIEELAKQKNDDYIKLAGLSLNEKGEMKKNVLKRLPWLIMLLVLDLIVSLIISSFEHIVVSLTTIVFYQSMVLSMSGNVGTQSLAVTIQALAAMENKKIPFKVILKELLIGFINGLIMGLGSFIVITAFVLLMKNDQVLAFKTGFTVGLSLILSMSLSSLVGSSIPVILTKLKYDPAVASGPFITTLNDIVGVLVYYGLASVLFFVL